MPGVAMTMAGPSESVFTWGAPPLVFGRGAFDEIGQHALSLGLRRLAIVTDPGLVGLGLAERASGLLEEVGITSSIVHGRPHRANGQFPRDGRSLGP